MSRTQDPSSPTHPRARPRRNSSSGLRRLPRRQEIEIIEAGRCYSWGRRGDAYYIWDNRIPGESLGHSAEANARREFRWLEQEAKIRRRRRRMRLLVGSALAFLAASPAVIVMYADGSARPSEPLGGTAELMRSVNEEGGYSFRAPAGWNVRTSEASTQVTSPNGDVTVSVLVAPEGDVDAASVASIVNIGADWTDTRPEAPQARTIGDLPAVSVGGNAIDGSGTPIRFLSFVIDSGTRNHAIWVSVPETWDAAMFLSSIEEILGSFRPLEAADA